MDDPAFDQDRGRWRNDDGDDITATWRQLVNVNDTIDVTSGDADARLRYLIQETAGNSGANFGESWEWDLNGAASWTVLGNAGSDPVIFFTSTQYSDQDNCTQLLGSGTFITLNQGMANGGNGGGSNEPDFSGSDESEFEQCLRFVSANLSSGDTLDFRIREGGFTVTDTVVMRMTIVKGAPSANVPASMASYRRHHQPWGR